MNWRNVMKVKSRASPDSVAQKVPVKTGRIARLRLLVQEIVAEPGLIVVKLRGLLVEIWGAKGGGFYGVGYVIAFAFFEVKMVVDDLAEAQGVEDFVFHQLIETVLRLGWMSFINAFQALLWPLMVAAWWDGGGLVLLLAGYAAFEYLLKPRLDHLLPELLVHRDEKIQAELDRKRQKSERKSRRKSKRKQSRQ